MKNNEYNIVNVTNDKYNLNAEFTNAQKVEYSFQFENKNPIKDELNDNSTINDKVEDNVSKSTKEKEKKKEKQEAESLEGSSSASSSTASSGASSAASSTAAASSAGATGGALGGIVAAATVSVAAIGTIVGVNVIGTQKPEPVTFLSSEVTSNSIDFSFSMASQLLRYEEVSGDTQLGEKMVVATISDGLDFKEEEYLVEYEEYDENVLIFFHSFSGLTPDTAYALTLTLREENPTTEVPNDQQLAYRTFRTDAVGQALKFDTIEATTNSVNFSFIVTNEAVEYDPSLARMPAIQATISDGADFYDEMWIEEISTYDDSNLMGSGNFTGLSASTEYTITLYVSLEQELRTLGSTTFTTQFKPSSGFSFLGEITPTEDSVSQRFYVSGDYIGYDPSDPDACVEKLIPAVTGPTGAEISGSVSLMTTSGSTVVFMATVTGLTGNTSYVLNIYFDNDGTREQLNDEGKQFTTSEATPDLSFNDDATVVDPEYVQFGFYLKTKYIQISEAQGETITNVYAKIVDGEGYEAVVNITNISESSSNKSYCTGKFEELNPLTTYTISVYVTGEETITFSETLEVSTPASGSANFSYVTNSFKISCNTITFDFNISKSFLGFDPDDEEGKRTIMSNLYAEIDDNQHSTVRTTTLSLEVVSGDTLVGTASADGLISSNDAYVMNFYLFDTQYQMKTCISDEPYYFSTPGPEFRAPTIPTEVSFYSHEFTITLDFDDDATNPLYDDLSLQFYDEPYDSENKYALGSSITLASITTEQTLLIPSSQDGDESYFEFDFDNIGSYVITANQAGVPTEVYHDDITFTDTDPAGRVTGVSNQMDCVIDASAGNFYLALQIEYTDDYDKLQSFYISVTPDQAGAEESGKASIIKTTNYQQAVFEDPSSTGNQGVVDYISNGGNSFTVNIYNWNDQLNPIYTQENVTIAQTQSNMFYYATIASTEFSEDDYEFRLNDLVYLNGDASKLSNAQIVFIDESNQEEYKYDYPLGYPSYSAPSFSLMDCVANPSLQNFTSYSDIVSAYSGKTFKIVIRYINASGTAYENYPLGTGVSFTFN